MLARKLASNMAFFVKTDWHLFMVVYLIKSDEYCGAAGFGSFGMRFIHKACGNVRLLINDFKGSNREP